jgi:transmembrane sensor
LVVGRLIAGLGAAAAACVAVVVGPRLLSARYGTALGEIRRVPLSDGSMAAINTDTALDVAMSPRLRHVKLDKGEAWFEVAKDARRPFVVESGPVRVRAVGTAFSVRVARAAAKCWSPKAWSRPGPKDVDPAASRGRRRADVRQRRGGRHDPAPAALEINRHLAWRDGQIVLDGDGFGEAAAEFNRYNDRKIVIAGQGLADEKLVGWFRTNEPEELRPRRRSQLRRQGHRARRRHPRAGPANTARINFRRRLTETGFLRIAINRRSEKRRAKQTKGGRRMGYCDTTTARCL